MSFIAGTSATAIANSLAEQCDRIQFDGVYNDRGMAS